jgi:hypothetical protein
LWGVLYHPPAIFIRTPYKHYVFLSFFFTRPIYNFENGTRKYKPCTVQKMSCCDSQWTSNRLLTWVISVYEYIFALKNIHIYW